MDREALAASVVFTDLDGTLLELETYAWRPAEEAVRLLHDRGVPLVFCSSKTRAEQEVYRRVLDVDAPFIVENGGAIFIPAGYFDFDYPFQQVVAGYAAIEPGVPVARIRQILAETRAEMGLACYGYADLPLSEVCRLTGLDEAAARRACRREYSETILRSDVAPSEPAFQRFKAALARSGLVCIEGSRFHTITGAGSDKGRAARMLSDLFRRKLGPVVTVGIGDGPNDRFLLSVVDRPFLVQQPGGRWAAVDVPSLEKIKGVGPAGWSEVIFRLYGS